MYIKAINTGKGFITHQDQQDYGLKFQIVVQKDGFSYIKVEGTEENINSWKTRVEGEETTETDVNEIVNSLPPTKEEELLIKVTELEAQVSTLTKALGDNT